MATVSSDPLLSRPLRPLPLELQFEIILKSIELPRPSLYDRDGLEEAGATMGTLFKLALVSKTWNEYITPLLYENVVLRSSSEYGWSSQVSRLERTLERRPDLALLVRFFRINVPRSTWAYKQLDITTSLYLLPNLQHVDLHLNLENIETALRRPRNRSFSSSSSSSPFAKPNPVSLTLTLPAYQKLTSYQIHSIYPDGDAPASTFLLSDFFNVASSPSLVSLDLYSQNDSYLFNDILYAPLPPTLTKLSVRIDGWKPYHSGNTTALLDALKGRIGGQLEFFHLQCETFNHGLPLPTLVLRSLSKIKTLSLDIDTGDLVGSLKGGNESVETMLFGDPARSRGEALREEKKVLSVLEEVLKVVGGGGGGGGKEKKFPSLRKVGFWSLSFRRSEGDAGDSDLEEVLEAVEILERVGLVLVDRNGEEWTRRG